MLASRPVAIGTRRRSLRRDSEGLSTTEYVILLLVVACVCIAGWRLFGTSAFERATQASGDVGQLGQSIDGPSGGGAGGAGGRHGGSSGAARSHLDDATADATPPPEAKDELAMPLALLAGAALLLLAMVAQRMKKKGGGGAKGGGK